MRNIRDHNRLFHNADSSLIDWDCKVCERLQTEYAESLAYYLPTLEPMTT